MTQSQSITFNEAFQEVLNNNTPIIKEWRSARGKQLAFPTLENSMGLIQQIEDEILGLHVCTVFDEKPPFEKMSDIKLARLIYKAIEREGFQKERSIYAFGSGVFTDLKDAMTILRRNEYIIKTIDTEREKKRWLCEVYEENIRFKIF